MTEYEMSAEDVIGACEAMLFVTDEALSALSISEMLGIAPARVQAALDELRRRLEARDAGIQLREAAGGWRLFTHPRYHDLIERYVISWDTRRLSQAALETLSVVAYNQPVTRAAVAGVRGVNSDSAISSLLEKGLVREAGREDSPGQPILYATTKRFLEHFGLRTLADLPDLESFAPDEESRALIRERLGLTRSEAVVAVEAFDDGDLELDLADDILDLRRGIEGDERDGR
ncbi:segregation and condensation protein B [Slackia sp. CM382]|uniref:SMC-Scp complex subunit ScpB n=1 Tax=Slackia sp. CM382 TaxID=1111137 RepID=UPI00027C6BB6|nr:SMC-Scp complex subunit ScpB [Slackia sp. CM382]EJU32775.1 segregation and condensation protein B [Slackia sp. CM382]